MQADIVLDWKDGKMVGLEVLATVSGQSACMFMGLLPVPWVVSAAGEGGALATEAEHGQGDEGLGAVESVCHAGDEPYLGID